MKKWTCPRCGLQTRGYGVYSHKRKCCDPPDPQAIAESNERAHVREATRLAIKDADRAAVIAAPVLRRAKSRSGRVYDIIGEAGNEWVVRGTGGGTFRWSKRKTQLVEGERE